MWHGHRVTESVLISCDCNVHPFHALLGLFALHGNIFLTFGRCIGTYFILQKWYFVIKWLHFLDKKMRPLRKLKVIELEEDEKEDEGAAKVWRLGREGVKLYWPPPFSATSDYSGQEEQAGAPTILPSSRPSLYPVPVPAQAIRTPKLVAPCSGSVTNWF